MGISLYNKISDQTELGGNAILFKKDLKILSVEQSISF
jgi:hypothetical protein